MCRAAARFHGPSEFGGKVFERRRNVNEKGPGH